MMRQFIKYGLNILLFPICYLFFSSSYAANQAILLNISGAIGPATQDYVLRGLDYAKKQDAKIIILQLDTPGGLETSMRGINKAILSSSVPVVAYVAPSGARATSAGTFILYASHIAAMAPGTNIGAASPVSINPKENNSRSGFTLEKKAASDAAAYVRSLAELRHRNIAWGEQAVRNAVSLSADEALKKNVINVIANNVQELLKSINGKTITLHGITKTLQTTDLVVEAKEPDWRYQFLSVITNPSIAYILLLIGIYGLFFEFYNPGLILPGIAGVISLLLALYAFQLLPINYAGFTLLLLGIAFMVIEVYVTSFGILGIGGVIAFAIGLYFLNGH